MKTPFTFLFILSCIGVSAQSPLPAERVPKDTLRQLEEVVVIGASEEGVRLRQQPINISVIQAQPFYKTNQTGLDLLRQVSGIKIKQSGGFGSRSDFFINGSTGKQVKFFIDGLPQDNLGDTQLLNVYPVEQIERLEVYKGVLPVDLGADALGAAINIVTRKEYESYLDASYSLGSFSTHRLNLSGKKYLSEHFFISLLANANYAQNNYRIDGGVPNEFGNIEMKSVKRFHDLYRNFNGRLQVGITNTRYADQLILNFINTGMFDEIQNNLLQTQPYGSATYKERLVSGGISYQKSNLTKNFDLSISASYNRLRGVFVDTSRNVYNWEGKIVDRKYGGGELTSSGHALNIYTDVLNGKITAAYRVTDELKAIFSNTLQHYSRTGKDTVAQNFYRGKDYYGTPSSLSKNISGIGLEGTFFNSKLRISTAFKNYATWIKGYEIDNLTQTLSDQSLHAFAYNAAIGYNVTTMLSFKTSYEHAARLPEAEEALGDFMLISPNPKIQIEQSENVNFTALYNAAKVNGSVTSFFRDVSNIIYLRTAQYGSQYQNLLSARVWGIEGNFRYQPFTSLSINGNFTYQDLRNQSVINHNGVNNERYKNARLPNIPYLFINGGVSWKKNNLLKENTVFQVWWTTNYTHEYFLYWEVDGARELKNRIPTQLLHHAGISYALGQPGLSLALEVNNLSNEKTYDNFRVQLPGRAFSAKIRMYLYQKENDNK